MKVTPVVLRLGVSLAVLAAVLAGCPAPSEDPEITIPLTSSEGTGAELSIADPSGLLVSASNVQTPRSADADIEVEAVPGAADELKVSWISSPCQETPQLLIQGETLDDLDLILDVGPIPNDVECPDIGVVFSVVLTFQGDVALEDVQGRRIGD